MQSNLSVLLVGRMPIQLYWSLPSSTVVSHCSQGIRGWCFPHFDEQETRYEQMERTMNEVLHKGDRPQAWCRNVKPICQP
jgi:hypothetical protein